MKRVHQSILARESNRCGGSYMQKVSNFGKRNGEFWEFSDEAYEAIRRQCPRGIGDIVAAITKPIARAIDAVIGTDLQNCGGCERRRRWLNRFEL